MIGRDRAIDIDTEEDFRFAELLYAHTQSEGGQG
jgi:CMP-N-acetylneuraminic acid synthetase